MKSLIRSDLIDLAPYSSARSEFSGTAEIYLDANENAYGNAFPVGLIEGAERYPEGDNYTLRDEIAKWRGVARESIFVGHGSDEAIKLLVQLFCDIKNKDRIAYTPPTYGMYKVAADITGVSSCQVPLKSNYSLDTNALSKLKLKDAKILFICNPNNPTGNLFPKKDLYKIINNFPGIVVIDEAYIDFCYSGSLLPELAKFKNLVITQTFSKAWGLAGARVGMAFASQEIIAYLHKIKPPYNLSSLSTKAVLKCLSLKDCLSRCIERSNKERQKLSFELSKLKDVVKVYPSQANFILAKFKDAKAAYQKLLNAKIVVRDRSKSPGLSGTLRFTVGTTLDNQRVLAALKGQSKQFSLARRQAIVTRETKESAIVVEVLMDGDGQALIKTRIGFLDHMLTQIAYHAGLNLRIIARGDLDVDEHHTIEDVAITLGQALKKALADKRGIERYGFVLPMDEAQAKVAIDLSGRSSFVWKVKLKRERVGDFPCEMAPHFFSTLAENLSAAIQIEASGENDHHILEAIFKSFARALKAAIKNESSKKNLLPSSKGVL
jgi:histidinol-phosphate aminotransferase